MDKSNKTTFTKNKTKILDCLDFSFCSIQTQQTHRRQEDGIKELLAVNGIGFHPGSQRREKKPGAESKLCGQTSTDSQGKRSASSAAHGSLAEVCYTPNLPADGH